MPEHSRRTFFSFATAAVAATPVEVGVAGGSTTPAEGRAAGVSQPSLAAVLFAAGSATQSATPGAVDAAGG